jgi:hypothetical protein
MSDGSHGAQMWELIRDGGLMDWLAAGHLVLGILLLVLNAIVLCMAVARSGAA